MKNIFAFAFLFLSFSAAGQDYKPSWESLDQRPVPAWFEDSKFGIFIHWGVYSVPAWGPSGDSISVYDRYAEWYWNKLTNKESSVNKYFKQFHEKTYGPNFKYQDFAPMFKAELFNPDDWAVLFKKSGARYVVLTSKHHEGFTLWPSAQSWNWNSVDIGPHRDLCGDLTAAVRKQGLHMGFYYSLYEWYNPLYLNDFNNYVDNHMIPQMKDLVIRYKPDLVWTDGEWEKTSKEWKSEDFLAWLFNESPVRENVAVNDRWGSETRSRHGGFYTTEYGLVGDKEGAEDTKRHPWEECRGIGTSFGYNRTENLDSYSTTKDLIKLLVKTVSEGGNLLLDIGPTADGRIPVIMQERLIDIGKWLEVNGEAIYGTRAFINGKKDMAINPETGRNIFFTAKGENIYVISTKWPVENIELKGLKGKIKNEASLLGFPGRVRLKAFGNGYVIIPPSIGPDENQPAYVFKLERSTR